MDIRQRIESLAARRGIQKKDLAERMGKRKENLNTLITNPKWDTIELVAQALGIEPWELFREEIEAAGLEIVKSEELRVESEGSIVKSEEPADAPLVSTPLQQALVCPHCHKAMTIEVR
jgi:transcriptional regulator with XRE-family HTH domain